MSDFDIGTLLEFRSALAMCEKCKAILENREDTIFEFDLNHSMAHCRICGVKYESYSIDYQFTVSLYEYLKGQGLGIHFNDLIEHSQQLASIARGFQEGSENYPPMKALFQALNSAEQFIHFTTYGLSHIILGALKLKAQTIPVRGVVSNAHSGLSQELKDYQREAENLQVRVFERAQSREDQTNTPHQKLIVIDGLMAFKGAANMTTDGWRKAAQGRDHIEVVTNIKEVIKLHNKLFSPIWAEFSHVSKIKVPKFKL